MTGNPGLFGNWVINAGITGDEAAIFFEHDISLQHCPFWLIYQNGPVSADGIICRSDADFAINYLVNSGLKLTPFPVNFLGSQFARRHKKKEAEYCPF
jgi:hypothetical protein